MQEFFDSVYVFFYNTVQRWNEWLISLEDDEKQLVTTEKGSLNDRLFKGPHAPIQEFQGDGFEFNLGDKKAQLTNNSSADIWINDFGALDIDAFNLIRLEQTLPDLKFLKKRYYKIAKQIHPDRATNTIKSNEKMILLNNAYENITRHLYEDVNEQITLFQAVFNTVIQKIEANQNQVQVNIPDTSSFIVLYLVGVAVGSVVVLKKFSKK